MDIEPPVHSNMEIESPVHSTSSKRMAEEDPQFLKEQEEKRSMMEESQRPVNNGGVKWKLDPYRSLIDHPFNVKPVPHYVDGKLFHQTQFGVKHTVTDKTGKIPLSDEQILNGMMQNNCIVADVQEPLIVQDKHGNFREVGDKAFLTPDQNRKLAKAEYEELRRLQDNVRQNGLDKVFPIQTSAQKAAGKWEVPLMIPE